MLRQTATTLLQGATRVSEAAGASASTDLVTKAIYAVIAALQHWSNSHNWSYLLTTAPPITLVAPFDVASTTNGTATLASSTLFGSVVAGDLISGTGIVPETLVQTVNSTSSITMNVAATNSAAITATFARRDYAVPTSTGTYFKFLYSARLLSSPRVLYPIDVRHYDRSIFNQTYAIPTHYTLYTIGGDAKLRLIPTPSTADTLILKYYRAMTIPAVGDTTSVLDIPQDYEFYLLGLAKALFLADKGGDPERQQFWWNYATQGLRQAKDDDSRMPDDDSGFMPGSTIATPYNPNSTVAFTVDL